MASSLIQIRVDDDLKAEATALYEALGIDLPTAVRMFIKRSVMVRGIPFSMTLTETMAETMTETPAAQPYKAESALRAMREISQSAEANGIAEMTLDEINAEISAAREAREKLKGSEQ